jgi:hypothetical protein
MPIPVISAASSILGFRRREQFAFTPAATNQPLFWTASGLPEGVSVETHPVQSGVTGVASTDVITRAAHGYENGQVIYFPSLTGGAGLSVNTWYWVRDRSADTFKVSAIPGGAPVDFTTDISAGQVRRVSNGRISGSHGVAGANVITLTATNGDGTSAPQQFVLGFSPELAPDVGGDLDAVPVTITLPSCTVAAGDAPLVLKGGDVRLLLVRFVDLEGARVDPDPATLRLVLKWLEPEPGLVETSAFEKVGSGGAAEFLVPVDLGTSRMRGAFSANEGDAATGFEALAEVEWTRQITFASEPLILRASTPNFPVQMQRDLVPN